MPEQKPIAIATAETVAFIFGALPKRATVVEVGCGLGDVAVALQELGFGVTGIDSRSDKVRIARAKGVRAVVGEWPNVEAPCADGVLFTRSLHHLNDLSDALSAAHRILRGPRRLLIEDFDFSSVNQSTVDWFIRKFDEADGRGLVRRDVNEFATRVAAATNSLVAWRAEHDPDLHSASEILRAVKRKFTIDRREDVPYLFRYFVPVLRETTIAAEWLGEMLAEERTRAHLTRIGRRIAATAVDQ